MPPTRSRRRPLRAILPILLFALWFRSTPAAGQDYVRAEQFLQANLERKVFGRIAEFSWMADSTSFWYRVMTAHGPVHMLVDPRRGTKRELFDRDRLAVAMRAASDTSWDPASINVPLPYRRGTPAEMQARRWSLDVVDSATIEIQFGRRRFRCDLSVYRCEGITATERKWSYPDPSLSPDGQWRVIAREGNLSITRVDGRDTTVLTTDGSADYGYAASSWSPDSKTIFVTRPDNRGIAKMPMYSSTSIRPVSHDYPYRLPIDSAKPRTDAYLVDVGRGRVVPLPGGTDASVMRWSPNGDYFLATVATQDDRRAMLLRVDVATATVTPVVVDSAGGGSFRLLSNSDIIWSSWRTGRFHLARLDAEGRFLNEITTGPFTLRNNQMPTEWRGQLFFVAGGRDPDQFVNYRHFYRVNLDGTGLVELTPEEADHQVNLSPSREFFIDTYSTHLDEATVVRSASDGRVLLELERLDQSGLAPLGWRPPELFRATGADGKTPVYGFIYRPTDFDPSKRYPVIDNIYPHGVIHGVWGFSASGENAQALAELGFIVIRMNGRGSWWPRDVADRDAYWRRMGENSLPDHVSALKELGARYRSMDLDRVGIWGFSGGGFASAAGILRYPDFYKVAVSVAGNHDPRSYGHYFAPLYQGPYQRDPVTGRDNYESEANVTYAKNLTGKLLLIHGDMDDNVHVANTLRLAHALIEADRDFDLLIVPDADHGVVMSPYVIRRTWDYFVRHLLGKEPPRGFHLSPTSTQ